MRLKTFLATYLLFLLILFSCFSIISVYMINMQMNMLAKKSSAGYQTIASTLSKDIFILSGITEDFHRELNWLVDGYKTYYRKNNIIIELTDITLSNDVNTNSTELDVAFFNDNNEHYIYVTGLLSDVLRPYKLEYRYNITEDIEGLRNIQNVLLLICIVFSIVTAFALYIVILKIFKPLAVVSKAAKNIANGHYNERINIKGKNELSAVADNFNKMADEIERQILVLEDEAAGKQQFIDNFAHEIRTPLTSIYGYAEYMQRALLDENEIIESTQFIMDRTNHMEVIADSLLKLATLRNYEPIVNEISIPQLFEDINQLIKKSLNEKNIKLICKSEASVLHGQEDLIKSLLLNLCFNALKACSSDSGIITMEAKKQDGNIELSVTDNGCGIPEENISKVTEPFYRVDKARNRNQGGAGLGLALCKKIVETHKANMIVDSLVGMGTTVKITFTTP